jgi:hypothetical protein
MKRTVRSVVVALAALVALIPGGLVRANETPTYSHVFVIVEENHNYADIIGNANAPNFNRWASTYGSSTRYDGTIHPSEGNYVGMVGGNSYGIENDNLWTTNSVNQPNLVDQLERANLSWKGYFENMPSAGYTGMFFDNQLYASKHNGFLNFNDINSDPARLNKLVPYGNFASDLGSGVAPNFSYIVPNQCNDMHGLSQCPDDQTNIRVADTWAGNAVSQITASSAWSTGNNAIVIVWDESATGNSGCCDANPGGGRVPFIVITNHGPRGLQDSTAGNHYSLVASIQQVFGLGCTASFGGKATAVGFTCDTRNVTPLSPFFAVSD